MTIFVFAWPICRDTTRWPRARRAPAWRTVLPGVGITGYTHGMKTAISIPDDLFREVEACSRRLKLSRSRLFAAAAREFLTRHGIAADATAAWNRAIRTAGQPGEETGAMALRKRTRAVIRASTRRSR